MAPRLLCALVVLSSTLIAQTPTDKLKLVVIVTRHGVRSPLGLMEGTSQKPWPTMQDWGVKCCGDLTPRGEVLIQRMGSYYRSYYKSQGLFLPGRCPAEQVYIWADNEERTVRTAESLAKGLKGDDSNCKVVVESRPYNISNCDQQTCTRESADFPDLWFHPLPKLWDQVSPQEKADINAAVKAINDGYDALFNKYREPLQQLQTTLGCCHQCAIAKHCDLFSSTHEASSGAPPAAPSPTPGAGTAIKWGGAFASGSTASEVFLLEYGNHMPCEQVGWNRVVFKGCPGPGYDFRKMQVIHTEYFQQVQRPPVVARVQGSNLLNQVLVRLKEAADPGGKPKYKLIIFSGHDTNVANVAALLGVKWNLSPDFPENDTPPGGALVFELYAGKNSGEDYVRMHYIYQSLEQLRTNAELTPQHPPQKRDLALPPCGTRCDFKSFLKIVEPRIDKNLVTSTAGGTPPPGKN